jgi:hypothetical protein
VKGVMEKEEKKEKVNLIKNRKKIKWVKTEKKWMKKK